jgi:plastocyanin
MLFVITYVRRVVMKKFITVLAVLLAAFPLSASFAYDGGSVSDGGTIAGVVKFKGTAPTPKKIEANKDTEVCGKTTKFDESLIVSGGNLVNAVVYITDIKKGKKVGPQKEVLDQKGCDYQPHVVAFTAGSSLEIVNDDGILHNIHSYSKVNTVFNIAQPKFKKTMEVKIEKPEVINVKCDVHGWMNGWLFSAENPYYAVTQKDGSFKLTDVPPGTYTVEVWHETLGKMTQKVTVKPKEEAKVNFEMAKK